MISPLSFKEVGLPVGAISAFAGKINTSNPDESNFTNIEELGWMVCDGRTLKAQQYPELFATLGYLYGGSEGKFQIPDLRGTFLRGVGDKNGSIEKRTKAPGGEDNGVGSTQECAIQKHMHQYEKQTGAMSGESGQVVAGSINDLTSEPTDSKTNIHGDVKVSEFETRPQNTFVYYIIKIRSRIK